MRINGKQVIGDYYAYDNCHKIYIIEDEDDMKQAKEYGYSIYDIKTLQRAFEDSCSLRFISNWKLDKNYVRQFESAIFEYVIE